MTSGSPASREGWSVGIDIGGTFTDVIAIGPRGSVVLKVASTPSNPSDAVASALNERPCRRLNQRYMFLPPERSGSVDTVG